MVTICFVCQLSYTVEPFLMKWGHLPNQDTYQIPTPYKYVLFTPRIRNEDTALTRTHFSGPMASVLESFHCILNRFSCSSHFPNWGWCVSESSLSAPNSIACMWFPGVQHFCNFRLQWCQLCEPIREQNSNPSAIWLDDMVLTLANQMLQELGKTLYTYSRFQLYWANQIVLPLCIQIRWHVH